MRLWLTIALAGLVLSCQGPAAVLAQGTVATAAGIAGCGGSTGPSARSGN